MAQWVRLALVVGTAILTCAGPARAGFISVALTAGADGSPTPSGTASFQFMNQSGSQRVGLYQFGGPTGLVQAGTGGGYSIYNTATQGVVLNLADGAAYLAAANAPPAARPSAGLASGFPDVGRPVPLDASLLALSFADPAANGSRVLSVYSADYTGEVTGVPGTLFVAGEVAVADGGWWVIGLTPSDVTPLPPPLIDPGPVTPPGPPSAAATPEPATLVMFALGLPLVGIARLFRR